MNPVTMDILVLLSALGGFAALMLAMTRHQQDWLGRKLSMNGTRAMRVGGYAGLALSFSLSCAGQGWAYGSVAALGWWTVAASLVVTANCNRARILSRLGRKGR